MAGGWRFEDDGLGTLVWVFFPFLLLPCLRCFRCMLAYVAYDTFLRTFVALSSLL